MFYWMEIIGTAVFAISGVLSAERKQLDFMGVVLVAFVVGNGGGTIRDVVMGATPVFWITNPVYIFAAIIPGICTVFIAHFFNLPRRLILLADALGLGLFVVVGASKALDYGMSPQIAIIMGVITAVGGGVIRDLLCDDIPLILKGEIYATPALVGAISYVFLITQDVTHWIAGLTCAAIVFIIRVIVIYYNLRVPYFFRGN